MTNTIYMHLPHPKLRSPRNRSACLWHLLNLVNQGYRYHTGGVIRDPKKVPPFVEKMHARFGVLLSPSGRARRRRRGVPTAHLVLYRDRDGIWLWWLLLAGDAGKVAKWASRYNETLQDAERTGTRLCFRDEYLLRPRQKTRQQGGGRAWTWFMTRRVQNAVEQELVSLASAHGRPCERTDDLVRAVERLRNRPMFGGVRTQANRALYRARRVWRKTHRADVPRPAILDEPLPWFGQRMRIFA